MKINFKIGGIMLATVPMSSRAITPYLAENPLKAKGFHTAALPDGVITMYFNGKIVTGKNKTSGEVYKAICISPLNNLEYDKTITLTELIKNKCICALHVQNGTIISLTLTAEKLKQVTDCGANKIAMLNGDRVCLSKESPMFRAFVSEEQYKQYVAPICSDILRLRNHIKNIQTQ